MLNRLWGLITDVVRRYDMFIREGERAVIFFTAFLCGSLASLLFDILPAWAWILWLIAALGTHMLCEQLYRRLVFSWYESNLRFYEEEE